MRRRQEDLVDIVADLAIYAGSRVAHVTRRFLSQRRRRRRLLRMLAAGPELHGAIDVRTPIIAPLSGERVAACRLIVDQCLDDGTWTAVFDETQSGELGIRYAGGYRWLDGPVILVRPNGTLYSGHDTLSRTEVKLSMTAEDLRAMEYILLAGEQTHVFGAAAARWVSDGPYRTADLSPLRPESDALVISTWTRVDLLHGLHQRPDLLPP
jgi:hypothetical protein